MSFEKTLERVKELGLPQTVICELGGTNYNSFQVRKTEKNKAAFVSGYVLLIEEMKKDFVNEGE